jgi:hypothetical protein
VTVPTGVGGGERRRFTTSTTGDGETDGGQQELPLAMPLMVTVKSRSPQQGMRRPSAPARLGPEGGPKTATALWRTPSQCPRDNGVEKYCP